MGTRDEETRRFFKHSSVHVLLCPRSAGKRHSWVKQQVISYSQLWRQCCKFTLYCESYGFVSKSFICLPFIMVFPPLQFFFVKWSALYCLFSYHLFICEVCVDQETGTIFTHHQKTIIVDADAGNYRRKIIAFVGGLDLCGGRYDTPWHPLFRTLQTVHKEDYYNPNFAVSLVYVQCLMYWYLEFF